MKMIKKTKKIFEDFFQKMGVKIETDQEETQEGLLVNIRPIDTDLTSLLIGYKGENLQAIQHMLRMLMRKQIKEPLKLIIDINGYRAKHIEIIKSMVLGLAERVKKSQRVELLRPMTAYERRAVHMVIQGISGVSTQSVGEEPNRRVIIRPESGE